MWKYVLRRIIIMVPVLGVMMVLSFLISRYTPGDPVMMALGGPDVTAEGTDRNSRLKNYIQASGELGLDKPLFYIELASLSSSDTLHRIPNLSTRAALAELTHRTGNWNAVQRYSIAIQDFTESMYTLQFSAENQYAADEIKATATILAQTAVEEDIGYNIDRIDSLIHLGGPVFEPVNGQWAEVKSSHSALTTEASTWKSYIPTVRFYGSNNQFHHWLKQVVQLDFGRSYTTKRPVWNEIKASLPWSMLLGTMAYLIAFSLAIGIGTFAVRNQGSWKDSTTTILLFLAHSVPSFVIAMLCITFLCSPQYLGLFPVTGISSDGSESWPFFYRFMDHLYHLILPTLVFAVHGVAGLSRQMRSSMLESMSSDYIRTARAKGLTEKKVLWRHAFRNSLPPLINSLSHQLPSIIMGSVFIETIFSLPGMGSLVVESMVLGDHPVVVAIFTLVGFATIVSTLAADILYALTDPRVTFGKA